MVKHWKGWLILVAVGVSLQVRAAAPPPSIGAVPEPPREAGPVIKQLLSDERNLVEKELAARMMKRNDAQGDKRVRLEMEIDLRIIQRALLKMAADAKPETSEQANAWLRAKAFRDAVRGMEDIMGQDNGPLTGSQKDAMGLLNKLTYKISELKPTNLDDFCKSAGMFMVNCANATPVNPSAILPMRPKPQTGAEETVTENRASVGDMMGEVQKLASISVPLRQQLLALASATSAAASADNKEEAATLYAILSQAIGLAKGLQSNTAVGNDARAGIEGQLAEGIVLYSDPRTRDAGKARIEALGQYRQTLTRIGKMGLTKEQMDQLGPAFAWAQANPDSGAKVLGMVEDFMNACAKWDAIPKDAAVPAALRRSLDDVRLGFTRQRTTFMQAASRMSGGGSTPAELEGALDEIKRLSALTDDLLSMNASIDTINAYKLRPVGGLEKKITTAALAAANSTPSANRNDGQKFLSSVHALAKWSQALSAKPLAEVPPAILQSWGGSSTTLFEKAWKNIIAEQGTGLIAGNIELDKAKVARLEMALALGDTLRSAAQLEAALAKAPALSRWADWAIDPASLQMIIAPYKESVSGAIFGYASDSQDALDKWSRLSGRYGPLIALVLRDVSYAEQCQALPIGLGGDVGRLTTPFENAPFGTERYASYAVGMWAALERGGEVEVADRVSVTLAKRIARDLQLAVTVDEGPGRIGKKPRP